MTEHTEGFLRIGELSRRVGVSPDTLRAWERRYGIMSPQRSDGGFRLYSPADEDRVREMQRLLAGGLAPAQAARRAIQAGPLAIVDAGEGDAIADLRAALEGFDDAASQAALDRLTRSFEPDSVVTHVVLPYLRDLGDRWARGEVTVAQEHFASGVIRARLMGLARGWDEGTGPRALLACGPDEHHDLPLICLGLAMRTRGWRITLLGADTPISTIAEAARRLGPSVCVVSATTPGRMRECADELRLLAACAPVVLAGPGASAPLAADVGARMEDGDPVTVAERLTRTLRERSGG